LGVEDQSGDDETSGNGAETSSFEKKKKVSEKFVKNEERMGPQSNSNSLFGNKRCPTQEKGFKGTVERKDQRCVLLGASTGNGTNQLKKIQQEKRGKDTEDNGD